jgi:predicted DNA-binding transcriptional regulator AlpA
MAEPEKLFSAKSVAEQILDCSEATVWRWVQEGKFPAPVKIAPKTTRWRGSDIAKWQAENGVAPSGEAA